MNALCQTTTGDLSGAVVDSSQLPVAGADVALVSELTGATWKSKTDSSGIFVLNSVPPGSFTLTITAQGFKSYQERNITLTALEKLSLGTAVLEVGSVADSITVTSAATPVQTASTERSAVLTSEQMSQLMTRGRDFLNLLKVMPGVGSNGPGAESLTTSSSPPIQGIRPAYNTINYDGVASNTSAAAFTNQPLNMDAIAEVKVLLGDYQAEYGRNSGAVINVATRSGTSQFHGNAYYYVRNKAFNANNFFNNRLGIPRPIYRYQTIGYNIGGPIFWPGKFNTDKKKLFFYFSGEYWPITQPGGTRYYTVPTQLERNGNFSQTFDLGGHLILINDPSTGNPFPGNTVPPALVNKSTQNLLNVFPLPNFTNLAVSQRNYNYVVSDTTHLPERQEFLRLDYNISDRLKTFVRGQTWYWDFSGVNVPANNNTWLDVPAHYKLKGPQVTAGVTYLATPALVNEFVIGYSRNVESTFLSNSSDLSKLQKQPLGVNIGQWYPSNNPLDLIPAASFGGVPNAAGISFDPRTFLNDWSDGWTISDGLAKRWGSHQFKAGIYVEKTGAFQAHHTGGPPASGSFAFDKDVNNPLDTNYAYSNALLGVFNSYTEASNLVNYAPYQTITEWYAQDNWRVSRRLVLEIGVRFTHSPPYNWQQNEASNLALERYNPAYAPALYFPALNAQGQRVAVDPTTGTLFPATYVGKIVPGSGNVANGAILAGDPTYPSGFQRLPSIAPAPRFGFAYDPFGDGKTAVRGGFGVFMNSRPTTGQAGNMAFNPPTIFTPSTQYGNVSTFLNTSGVIDPTSWFTVIQKNASLVQSYNMHFGVQRKLWFDTVLDLAYSGTLGRHLGEIHDINEVPYGTEFAPAHRNPTTGTPLPDNFYRPYQGYASIPYLVFDANSSYHSLQVQVTRRFSKGVQFGGAWTWSKAMDYADGSTIGAGPSSYLATYNSWRVWNYGKAGFDQTHALVVNWLWNIPQASRVWNNALSRWVLDDWQLSGIATFASGFPNGVTFNTTDGANLTGGGDGARVVVTGNPVLPRGQRSLSEFFNTSVFARPAQGTIGNAPKDVFRGPGINNWDLTLFKNFRIRDRVTAQLRWEAYNTFNHTQWMGVGTNATFDPAGNQVNGQFGQVTSARDPRIMQLAARVKF